MKIGLWARVLLLAAALTGLRLRGAERPDLTGSVKAADGSALRNASVFIYTAGPKEGPGVLCPSCYADCAKRARTDGEGRFTIEDLDPALLFRVLVVAKGHRPEFVAKVDPASGPIQVALKAAAGETPPDRQMRGRVLGSGGKPLEGAVVSIRGVSRGNGTRFGGNDDVDPVAVSDEDGSFVISGREAFDAVGVDVEARAHAKGVFPRLATGGEVHELRLVEGASVKGRLTKDGSPLAGVEIGISGSNRESSVYVGNWTVGTDKDGQFLFVNLPPDTAYQVYGKMESLGDRGAVPTRAVRTGETGSTSELGELKVGPSFKVEGRLVLTDGAPLPEKTRVSLGREDAWDSQQKEVGADGRFAFAGVPAEIVTLSTRVKGYRFTARNASLDPNNPFLLTGRVIADKTDLLLQMEPGKDLTRLGGDQQASAEEPLRGAEPAGPMAGGSGGIELTGTVVDDATGEPLKEFTVTEGRKARHETGMTWFEPRKTEFKQGGFALSFFKSEQAPAALIEAEGYLPQAIGPIEGTKTNVAVRMKKGGDIAAVLLRPDGSPASNTTVYLTDTGRNGVYVNEAMEVRENAYQGTKSTRTDSSGRFSFPPQIDAFSVIVVDDAGFANVPVAELKGEVRLKKWAKVQGTLMIGAKAGTNEQIRLWPAHIPYDDYPRQFSALQIYLTSKTDEAGRFAFDRVPPMAMEVYHEPKVRDSRMGTIPMSQTTKFLLAPGETKELTLGGKGRPVVGKFVVPDYEGTIDWRADVQTLELVVPEPDRISMKAFYDEWTEKINGAETDEAKAALRERMRVAQEKKIAEIRDFYSSDAGLRHHFAKKRYALNFAADGSFRVEDVPGGKYALQVELREPGGGEMRFNAPRIASLRKEIEVPDSPGGRTDEPHDLGTIQLQAKRVLKAGKAAPPFEVKTLDGKTAKLEDYKGKFLLLDFWAVWCGPCVAETPHLKETYEQFKNDKRFAMLALSLDPKDDAPRKYAAQNGIAWTQGFLGEWSKAELPARYGVEGIPAIFLIGPDGNVVATGLRGEGIRSAVASALQRF